MSQAFGCAELCPRISKTKWSGGNREQCSSSRAQSKISLYVRNELETMRRLWLLDVIIMPGCQGHEDECCLLPCVPPQCQPFAESSSLKGPHKVFVSFIIATNESIYFFVLSWLLFVLSRQLLVHNLEERTIIKKIKK